MICTGDAVTLSTPLGSITTFTTKVSSIAWNDGGGDSPDATSWSTGVGGP
jgi:hypothetical protein